jgi:hypothetical protein
MQRDPSVPPAVPQPSEPRLSPEQRAFAALLGRILADLWREEQERDGRPSANIEASRS